MTATTPASGFVSGADETKFFEYQVPASLFTNGDNTIAVELHQPAPGNIDASFDLELVARAGNETNAPSAPAPAISDVTSSTATVSWTEATDDVSVIGYLVRRNGVVTGFTTALSVSDFGLTPNTAYSYDIRAVDTSGNVSAAGIAATHHEREHRPRALRRRLVLPDGRHARPAVARSHVRHVVVAERAEPARLGRPGRDHGGPDRHAHPVLRPPLQRRRHHAVPAAHAAAEA